MAIRIKNGRVLDPSVSLDEICDVLIQDGKILKIERKDVLKEETKCEENPEKISEEKSEEISEEKSEEKEKEEVQEIDAEGCFVMPGFIDLHTHMRDPGQTKKEDIESGSTAAVHGGFTTILAMPNTHPVADNVDVINYVKNKADSVIGGCCILQVGAATKKQKGKEIADLEEMIDAGIPAVSEDGKSVMDAGICLEVMKIAAKRGIPVFAHCEDRTLLHGGVINEGIKSKELDLPGISNLVEDLIIARDLMLAKEAGAKLHICHLSTAGGLKLIEDAKKEGMNITVEVCPHHFTLCDEDIPSDDANYKMNPPLRSRADMEALRDGLKRGVIDCISTDHAPHTSEEKYEGFKKAPFGIVGLETAAALTYTELVDTGILTPLLMAEKMSYAPAKIISSDRGTLQEGSAADVVIFNPGIEETVDVKKFASKGKNTPFAGRKVKGKVVMTIRDGKIIYQAQA